MDEEEGKRDVTEEEDGRMDATVVTQKGGGGEGHFGHNWAKSPRI